MEPVESEYVYLDYAATAPLVPAAVEAMASYFVAGRAGMALDANANSLHSLGRRAFSDLERARSSLARSVGAHRPTEIMFTSGATEADNAAIVGMARAARNARVQRGHAPQQPRVIVSAIEHDAVLEPARALAREGFDIVELGCDASGHIDVERFAGAIDEDTLFVSIQAVNSEMGAVQPIEQLAAVAHEAQALFHTDATQALGKIPVDVQAWGVDAASFSAHKIGGPKGAGALYLRARTPFSATMLGGGQESGARSGTQNVCGAVGFAAAAKAAVAAQPAERARLSALRDRAYELLCAIPGVRATVDATADPEGYAPHIAHVTVDGFESETLILRLDLRGIMISGGSACSSSSLAASHVLRAMGMPAERALGALRVSMGAETVEDDIDRLAGALRAVVEEGR